MGFIYYGLIAILVIFVIAVIIPFLILIRILALSLVDETRDKLGRELTFVESNYIFAKGMVVSPFAIFAIIFFNKDIFPTPNIP
jgi:hypothetical protein